MSLDAKVAFGAPNTLSVGFEGKKFIVTLDDKKVIEVTDHSLADAGKVGVWTRADKAHESLSPRPLYYLDIHHRHIH